MSTNPLFNIDDQLLQAARELRFAPTKEVCYHTRQTFKGGAWHCKNCKVIVRAAAEIGKHSAPSDSGREG